MNRSWIISALVIAGLAFATTTLPAAPFDKEFKVAKVLGPCTVLLPGASEGQPAKEGGVYPYGTTIMTGRKASLVVVLSEGNEVRVLAETAFKADQNANDAADKTIRLKEGRIQVKLDPKFHETNKFTVETPSAVCGAIGCEFEVQSQGDVQANNSTITVVEGKVKISYTDGAGKAGELDLKSGDKVRISVSIGKSPTGQPAIIITMVVTRADGTMQTVSFWLPWTVRGAGVVESISRLFTSGTTPTPVGKGRGR